MRTLTVRLPEALAAEIESESKKRGISKSDIVRERLQRERDRELPPALDDIADLIGSVDDDRPSDLSARKKHYLRVYGFGRNRSR
jgi:ribbon-helix-helix CopG family protein